MYAGVLVDRHVADRIQGRLLVDRAHGHGKTLRDNDLNKLVPEYLSRKQLRILNNNDVFSFSDFENKSEFWFFSVFKNRLFVNHLLDVFKAKNLVWYETELERAIAQRDFRRKVDRYTMVISERMLAAIGLPKTVAEFLRAIDRAPSRDFMWLDELARIKKRIEPYRLPCEAALDSLESVEN